jgi:hypothetical protein
MSKCKASETRDPPSGWGAQAKRGQIPRNEATYKHGLFPTASYVTLSGHIQLVTNLYKPGRDEQRDLFHE